MTTCRRGHEEVVQLLIESGADLNLQNGVLYIIPLRRDWLPLRVLGTHGPHHSLGGYARHGLRGGHGLPDLVRHHRWRHSQQADPGQRRDSR